MTTNYSLLAIPGAWLLALAPHMYATRLIAKHLPEFDAANPRHALAEISNTARDEVADSDSDSISRIRAIKLQILRGEAAQSNGFENLGLFTGAVLAANISGIPVRTLNQLCVAYLVSRVVYNVIYINVAKKKHFYFRTLSYNVGGGIIIMLYIKSFFAMNR